MKDSVYIGRVPIVRIESPGGSARHYISLVTLGSTRTEILDADAFVHLIAAVVGHGHAVGDGGVSC